jgi:hypothetical protein
MKSTPKPSDTVNQNGYRQDFAATYYTSKFQLEIEIPELVAYVKAKDLLLILQNL